MPALGDEFRSAREARGLSLPDVAERLHIRTVYLAAIEDEDWKAIGAPVYIRGFMRTYARFLGLDAEDAVARFSSSSANVAPAVSRAEERSREPVRTGERSRPSIVAILAMVVAAAVVAYVGYAYFQYHNSAPAPVAAASPEGVTDAPAAADASPAAAPVAIPLPVHSARPKRNVHIDVTQTSWLRVTIDGSVVTEGTFPAGTSKSYVGNVVDVRTGNAGGIAVAVNGRAVGPLGASGDVVERRFTLSGE